MNITSKIIITDTNIITDLNNANLLEKFVKLDNVYISDMVKNDEIKTSTGDINLIKQIKVIETSGEQFLEMMELKKENKKLSTYDLINYILARDNNFILATGDNRLKDFAEKNNVEVIRTLKIIKLLNEKSIISSNEAINACELLKLNPFTRIPEENINNLISELEKDLATC